MKLTAAAMIRRPGWALAFVALAIHLYASGGYGYFRDELYFIVCGERLDWGYVDQPPLVPLIAWLMHSWFPGSLVMLRLVPALAHAGLIVLTAETARLLGGGRWAQALAGLSVLVGGVYLAQGTLLITDVFQPLTWLFCGYALIRLVRRGDERWWLAVGVVAGIAMQSKYMIAFWLVALGAGVLLTPERRLLLRPKLYVGATIAGIIILPNVLWQAAHDWPFLEIGRVAATSKNVALSPVGFVGAEIDTLNPVTAFVWLTGLAAFAFWRRFADLRCFAIGFVVLMAAMIAMHAKPYYPVGAYPLLFAGGAVALEAWVGQFALRAALTAVIAVMGVVAAPFALPILPVERFASYQSFLGLTPKSLENSPIGRLPQHFADMFGWRELAALVGKAYQSLPAAERSKAVF